MAASEDTPIRKSATPPGSAVQLASLTQVRKTESVPGSDAKVETQSAEADAQTTRATDTLASAPGVRSPFRLVVHFAGPDRIRGGAGRDFLHGTPSGTDHFDADAGGDDILFGMGGDDIYWLGTGTGRDTIVASRSISLPSLWLGTETEEDTLTDAGDTGSVIRLKSGLTADNVQLVGGPRGIHVVLVNDEGTETDRYTVVMDPSFGVERVELSSGETVFDRTDLNGAWSRFTNEQIHRLPGLTGVDPGQPETDGITRVRAGESGARRDIWTGTQADDSFLVGSSSESRPDVYQGGAGNDVYWLGLHTGHDRVNELVDNPSGDIGDAIVIQRGISAPRQGLGADLETAVSVGGGPTAWLRRSPDGRDLVIDVVERQTSGQHTRHSSLTVEEFFFRDTAQIEQIVFADDPWASLSVKDLRPGRIRGDILVNFRHGTSGTDHFDTDGGSNDILLGLSGDDVYWLGPGTGRDTIYDTSGPGDTIRLKSGLGAENVRLAGDSREFHVVLLNAEGVETDRYTLVGGLGSSVKRVELSTGEAVFEASDFTGVHMRSDLIASSHRIRDSILIGTPGPDHFDTDGGDNQTIHGLQGDDVYWLGPGTGRDTIIDVFGSDTIRLETGLTARDVRLVGDREGLHVVLVDVAGTETDRYTVLAGSGSSVQRVELSTGETVFDPDDFFDTWKRSSTQPGGSGTQRGELIVERKGGRDTWSGSPDNDDSFRVGSSFRAEWYRGFGGNDIYWLGIASGHDSVHEHWGNPSGDPQDIIIVESGISAPRPDLDWSQVRKLFGEPARDELDRSDGFPVALVHRDRSGRDLVISVVEKLSDGTHVTYSSLGVEGFFTRPRGRIEQIVFAGDPHATLSLEDLLELPYLPIIDGLGDDILRGGIGPDVFDSSVGGNDQLYGNEGDDTYYLGVKTGIDTVREESGGNDRVIVKEGIHIPDLDRIHQIHSGVEPTLRVHRESYHLILEVTANGEVLSALKIHLGLKKKEGPWYSYGSDRNVEGFYDSHGQEIIATSELMALKITGGAGCDDTLYGLGHSDHFDVVAGGHHNLYGWGGSDVYWLGYDDSGGTAKIFESGWTSDHDVIRLKEDIDTVGGDGRWRSLKIWRSDHGADLHVALLADGDVVRTYTAVNQFVNRYEVSYRRYHRYKDGTRRLDGNTEIEAILSVDGDVIYDIDDIREARIVGGAGDDILRGTRGDDHFDGSRGGSDHYYGDSGDDVYWLGRDTGSDHAHEYSSRDSDFGDAIRIASPHIERSDVRVAREGDNLIVGLIESDGTHENSITVVNHFRNKYNSYTQVEKIQLNGATLLVRDLVSAIDAIAEFNAGGWNTTLDLVPDSHWQDPSDSLTGPAA